VATAEGEIGFGSKEERVLDLHREVWNEGEKQTPGPGHYDAKVDEKGKEWEMHAITEAEAGHKSAAFASTSKQRENAALPSADIPGPGTYNPNDACTIEHLPGANPESNIVSKVGRDGRYGGDTVVGVDPHIGATIGPGSYESQSTLTIAKEVRISPRTYGVRTSTRA
jgi:hypothetical protein